MNVTVKIEIESVPPMPDASKAEIERALKGYAHFLAVTNLDEAYGETTTDTKVDFVDAMADAEA